MIKIVSSSFFLLGGDWQDNTSKTIVNTIDRLSSPSASHPSQSPHHCHVPSSSSFPFACHLISPAHSAPHLYLPGGPISFTPTPGSITCDDENGLSSQQEIHLMEIKRLRERLVYLEKENTCMSYKLSQKQWDIEERLKGIEMMMAGKEDHIDISIRVDDELMLSEAMDFDSSDDENERNKESII